MCNGSLSAFSCNLCTVLLLLPLFLFPHSLFFLTPPSSPASLTLIPLTPFLTTPTRPRNVARPTYTPRCCCRGCSWPLNGQKDLHPEVTQDSGGPPPTQKSPGKGSGNDTNSQTFSIFPTRTPMDTLEQDTRQSEQDLLGGLFVQNLTLLPLSSHSLGHSDSQTHIQQKQKNKKQ